MMDKVRIPVFIVSIAGSEAKLERVRRQIDAWPELGPVVVTGVVGRFLPDSVCRKLTNDPNSVNNKGALGCFLSHVRIWERIAEIDCAAALVLEDDVICRDLGKLAQICDQMKDADFLFVNDRTALHRPRDHDGQFSMLPLDEVLEFICRRNQAVGTDGYLIAKQGAAILLDRVGSDGYFSHIDLRIATYSCSDKAIQSVGQHKLGRELLQLKNVCGNHEPLRTYAASRPLVTHVAEGSSRVMEDLLVSLERDSLDHPRPSHDGPAATPSDRSLMPLRAVVESYLEQFSGQNVLYFPNPGNGGDSLIACGTYEAFDRANVRETVISYDADVSGKTVFVGGGGNLVPMYGEIKRAVETFAPKARRLIILPHTIREQDPLLLSLGSNVTIFCREMQSYEYVRSLALRAEVCLAHDMAFHIDATDVMTDAKLTLTVRETWQRLLAGAGYSFDQVEQKDVMNFMRSDWEAIDRNQLTDMDVSHIFSFGVNRHYAFAATWCMLHTLAISKAVVTDRLHVAIASACIGAACRLSDNSYGKNRAVYEHSMKGRFPSIKLGGTEEQHRP